MARVTCPDCGEVKLVGSLALGKMVECDECGERFHAGGKVRKKAPTEVASVVLLVASMFVMLGALFGAVLREDANNRRDDFDRGMERVGRSNPEFETPANRQLARARAFSQLSVLASLILATGSVLSLVYFGLRSPLFRLSAAVGVFTVPGTLCVWMLL